MRRKIFPIFLIISALALSGCAMLSPFKSINTCADAKNNGAACATVESNLFYSVEKDEKAPGAQGSPEVSAAEEEKTADSADAVDSGEKAVSDEIRRLAAELSETASSYEKPVFIPARVYRMMIFPYSSGERFYSARYVYITAGRTGWISGGYAVTDGKYRKIDFPSPRAKTASGLRPENPSGSETVSGNALEITETNPKTVESPEAAPVKAAARERYRVAAYYLNCRDEPGTGGRSLKILNRGDPVEIAEKPGDWWKIYVSGEYCYVNSAYLEEDYSE